MTTTVYDGVTSAINRTVFGEGFVPIVDDYTVFVYQVVVNVFTNGVVSAFGIVANVFNIVVFVRQGIFTESGTAGIFGLAVSDLCCVFTMFWLCVIEAVVLADPPNLSWDPDAVKTATAFWVHMMFAHIARVVTVYIAFERCVCVMLPFKVKSLLNPKRALFIMTCMAVSVGLLFTPHLMAFPMKYVTDPTTNVTRLVTVPNVKLMNLALDQMIYATAYATNIFSVVAVFVFTVITAIRINLSKTWRDSMSSAGISSSSSSSSSSKHITETAASVTKADADRSKSSSDNNQEQRQQQQQQQQATMSKSKMRKEVRLVRMIISISVVFLICYIPLLVYLIMITVNRDLGLRGKYKNFSSVMYTFSFLMETFNSSINIVIYYTMSSRYREVLRALLGLKKKGT